MLKEFKEFIARGNVIDLAVGVIIGGAFGAITTSLVNDVVMPVVGLLLGKVDFGNLFVVLSSTVAERPVTVAAAKAAGIPTLNYGLFINTIINFLLIAFAVFMLVKFANRIRRQLLADPTPEAAAPPEDVLLLREIRDELKRRA